MIDRDALILLPPSQAEGLSAATLPGELATHQVPLAIRHPPLATLLGGLLLASSTLAGCTVPVVAAHKPTRSGNFFYSRMLDDFAARMTARKVARKHLAQCQTKDSPAFSCDYRRGFEQAYVDVALGASGSPPAVPPPLYWHAGMRTPEGHARAEEWYHGYCHGGQQAAPLRGEFNRVQSVPPTCQTSCGP